MANRSKVLRSARHRHHVAGGEVLEHFEKLAAVVVRARDLLAVNPAAPFGAQLLKLCVERLSVGAHTGIAETPVFAGWFGLGFQFRSGRDLVITPESKTWLVRWCLSRGTGSSNPSPSSVESATNRAAAGEFSAEKTTNAPRRKTFAVAARRELAVER